jgi:hypothetical protein
VFFRYRLSEGSETVGIVAVDFELIDRDGQCAQRVSADSACGEIEAGFAVELGPLHVVGMTMASYWH